MRFVYSSGQRAVTLGVCRCTRSVTKTVRELGYPGRWTLYSWLRKAARSKRKRRPPHRYSVDVKLCAIELLDGGWLPRDAASELGLTSAELVYGWARCFREWGEWGLMTPKQRRASRQIPTRQALEATLLDDPGELRALAAKLLVDKAVLEQEFELVKRDENVTSGEFDEQG